MWKLDEVQRLRDKAGVYMYTLAQCRFGCRAEKLTDMMSNMHSTFAAIIHVRRGSSHGAGSAFGLRIPNCVASSGQFPEMSGLQTCWSAKNPMETTSQDHVQRILQTSTEHWPKHCAEKRGTGRDHHHQLRCWTSQMWRPSRSERACRLKTPKKE